ncbi:MAG: hypothetical protein LBM98_06500, partial [Oscillospiraceae bacterium]|nr:hypothetical protein [Oscillospiraceae bacterium]
AECYRCEAIQCRGENIRICGLRHGIASRLNNLRISSFAALRKDALGAWTGFDASNEKVIAPPR